jgi:hypothetical protein
MFCKHCQVSAFHSLFTIWHFEKESLTQKTQCIKNCYLEGKASLPQKQPSNSLAGVQAIQAFIKKKKKKKKKIQVGVWLL